jgi:hypothetical protein
LPLCSLCSLCPLCAAPLLPRHVRAKEYVAAPHFPAGSSRVRTNPPARVPVSCTRPNRGELASSSFADLVGCCSGGTRPPRRTTVPHPAAHPSRAGRLPTDRADFANPRQWARSCREQATSFRPGSPSYRSTRRASSISFCGGGSIPVTAGAVKSVGQHLKYALGFNGTSRQSGTAYALDGE